MSHAEVFVLALVVCGSGGLKIVPRVAEGKSDHDQRYPYVGAIINPYIAQWSVKNMRGCTGSIITPEWVLTAGHCTPTASKEILQAYKFFFAYGDLSLPLKIKAGRVARILYGITPSYNKMMGKNDIGLVMIEAVKLKAYGKVSSLDYKSLVGYAVEYAGAGGTYSEDVFNNKKLFREALKKDQTRPLQIGHGVVAKCDTNLIYPSICLRPKCSLIKQRLQRADSGGPLFYKGKIIAVVSTGDPRRSDIVLTQFTPVSPYLDWIRDNINKDRRKK